MRDPQLPPGWPREVLPPHAPEWERSAVAWMFELVPPDYRLHDVLRRHPVVLARFAAGHVRSGIEAARAGLATARADLRDLVPVEVVEAALAAYQREGARLTAVARELALVEGALRGRRWVPRL